MRITSITHSGGSAQGEGLMDVPVMKAQLRVAFSNARINAQKRLYEGTVNGLYDNSGVIPAGWTVGGSMSAGFNPAAAAAVDNYLQTGGRLNIGDPWAALPAYWDKLLGSVDALNKGQALPSC